MPRSDDGSSGNVSGPGPATVSRGDRAMRRTAANEAPLSVRDMSPSLVQGHVCRSHGASTERPVCGVALEPEAFQELLVAAPLRGDFHVQLEEDAAAEQRLDLGTGARPDLLHDRASLTDEDHLLRLCLDEDPHAHHLLAQLLDLR